MFDIILDILDNLFPVGRIDIIFCYIGLGLSFYGIIHELHRYHKEKQNKRNPWRKK